MQRTIKFRGKRVDNGQWVYGNVFFPDILVKGVYISETTSYADFAPGFEDGDNYDERAKDGIVLGRFFQVYPATVGQFTGLHDKNGAEIYEGDIVKWSSWKLGSSFEKNATKKINTVEWSVEKGKWFIENDLWDLGIHSDIEVIGNKYDNPDLLK